MTQGRVGAPVGGSDIRPFWRWLFWTATVFNFAVGLAGMLSPEASIDARIVGLLVFCFGVIYLLVARDPIRFAPALWAGVIGKVGVVALLAPAEFGAGGSSLVLGVLILDGLFALCFLAFLLTYDDAGQS